MADYQTKMSDLSQMSAEDLAALKGEIVAAFDAADEADDLDAMAAAGAALDEVRAKETEMATDETTAPVEGDEVATEPAEESAPAVAEESADEPTGDEDEDNKPKKGKNPFPVKASGEPDTSTDSTDADGENADGETDQAITASADSEEEEPQMQTVSDKRAPVAVAATNTITAGADVPGLSAGSVFTSLDQVSEAMVHRIRAMRGARGGDGEKAIVASISSSVPDDRILHASDLEGNAAKIRKVTGTDALVASGGYCAPLEVRYDLFGLGVADRPVKDALAGFQADRGGIRFNTPPMLGQYEGAVGVWTADNDASETPNPATKPIMEVFCPPEQTAEVDAITLQLKFGNLMSRAYPELVTRHNQLGLIQHARLAEQTLLTKINSLSTAVTAAKVLGTARDFLEQAGRAATAYRSRHRMNRTDALRILAPAWVLDAMREDLARGLPGDALSYADSVITGFFSDRNVNVSWHMEQPFPAQTAGALTPWPTTFNWQIFAEGTFLFLDGGTLDLGIVRDSGLVATNDYIMFVETFEGVAKVGIESLSVTSTHAPNGSVSGTVALNTAPV